MSTTRFVDRIVDNLDAILAYAHGAVFKTNPKEMLDLFTTDDDHTFVTKDGSLISVIRVRGITSTMYAEELQSAITEISEVMGKGMLTGGEHSINISFEFDPDAAYDYAKRALGPTRKTAHRLRLGSLMDAVFEEKAQKMAEYCQVENCYLALITTPAGIHKSDRKSEVKARSEAMRTWPETAEAMLNDFAYPMLRTKHRTMVHTFISSMKRLTSLKDVGLLMELISVKAYLREVKRAVEPETHPQWEPRIAADVFQDLRVPVSPKEQKPHLFDSVMPPALGDQIFSRTPQTVGLRYAILGNRVYYPVALSIGPKDPETFDRLIQQASDLRLPFRISFGLKAGGTAFGFLNSMLAKVFFWTSNANNQIKNAYNGLKDYEDKAEGCVPAMYVTACTWAPLRSAYNQKKNEVIYDLNEINDRASKLNRSLQAWGGCQTTDTFNAPLEGVMATQAAMFDRPLGGVMAPPMAHAVGMSPLFRPTTSWTQSDGNVLLRSDDGRYIHYQQTSSKQNAWVTLVVGPMGFSKSTTLNTLNLMYLLNPSPEPEIPYLRCMDIGPSSRSIVDLVQASLRPGEEYIAQYIRIQNAKDYQVNVFDTQLGCEFPLPNHANFLVNFISTICYSMEADASTAARLPGLVSVLVKKLYKDYASRANGGDRARLYYVGGNSLVDQKIDQHGIEFDELTSWHEIRDALFDAGEMRAALIAHRKAMPVLGDLIGVAATDEIRSDYPDMVNGVSLIDLFIRSIREAMELYPIMQGETRFELGEARVIALDMEDLVPREQTDRAFWQASIAFFIGYDMLTKDFFFHRDYLKYIPKRFYKYHARRVKNLETARKRFSMDERQRFANIRAAQQQVDSLIAEGRKNFIDIQVASQLFEHHTEQSIKLATTIVMLGAGNMDEAEIKMVKTRFSLTDTQMGVLNKIRPPTQKGAEALFVFRTREGNQVHHVLLTEGPIYLWLIATEAVDRSIRAIMYDRFPKGEALMRLAKRFPGGSIKKELEAIQADELDRDDDASEDLIKAFADECSEQAFTL